MSGGGFDVGCTSAKDARRAAGSRESSEKRVVDTLHLLPVFGVGGGGGGASSCAGGGAAALAFSRAVSEKFSRFNRATSLRKAASSLSSRRRIGDRTGVFVGFFTALRAAFAGRSGASGRGAFCAVWMMSAKGFATVARRSAMSDAASTGVGAERLIWAPQLLWIARRDSDRPSGESRSAGVLYLFYVLRAAGTFNSSQRQRQCKRPKNQARPVKTLGK